MHALQAVFSGLRGPAVAAAARQVDAGLALPAPPSSLQRWHSELAKAAFQNCEATVKKHDYENFQWIRALPAESRAPITALRALNAEVTLIGDLVRQGGAPLREMRFTWWKEAVDKVYNGEAVNHPVLIALSYVLGARQLSKYRIQRIIASKANDQVEHRPPATLHALEDWAEGTSSNLHYLQLEAIGVKDRNADHAASHLGKAVAIAATLRGARHLLKRGISYLPVDLCAKHGVVVEELFQGGQGGEELSAVVYELASVAHGHLQQSTELHGKSDQVPRAAKQTFLSGVGCGLYLQALEQCSFDVFHPRLRDGGYTPLWFVIKLQQARWGM